MKLTRESRELRDWITSNGYGELIGLRPGGHLAYRLSNGRTYITSTTPSDNRYLVSVKTDIRRLLGVAGERTKAARYKHCKNDSGFRATIPKHADWQIPEERLLAETELSDIDDKLRGINVRREPDKARALARRRLELEQLLARYGVTIGRLP